MSKRKNTIEYKTNKNLPIVKDGWKGNVVINGEFHNDKIQEKPPIWNVIKWKLSRNPQRKEKKSDNFKLASFPLKNFSKTENKIVWLGHSSFIITLNKITLITDPLNTKFFKKKITM